MISPMSSETAKIHELIPHRDNMLLIDAVLHADSRSSSSRTTITEESLFHVKNRGVPAWVGMEIMGQTAALIAGYQEQQGHLSGHTGFLIASREYSTNEAWFRTGSELVVHCEESALVGEGLANFECSISTSKNSDQKLATATLTVLRQSNDAPPNTVDSSSKSDSLLNKGSL